MFRSTITRFTNTFNGEVDTHTQHHSSTWAVVAYITALIFSCICAWAGVTAFHQGIDYIELGHGLHPYLAVCLGMLFMLAAVLIFWPTVDLIEGLAEAETGEGD